MSCPLRTDGVHYFGTNTVCACGYTLAIPRFVFSIEIHDNDTHEDLANEGFSCSHIETVKEKLLQIAEKLR